MEASLGSVWARALEEARAAFTPKHGDKVWYKDRSGFETHPVLFTVVAENEGVVWVKDVLEDKLVFSHELTPFTEGEER